jgi:heterodisulfide reductase subunit C2
MFRLSGDPQERAFLKQIIGKSGQNLLECLQCGKCTAGCPIASESVPGPRQLIATILIGMKEAALRNPTWLYCVSCGTCATRCPVEINMYAVATVLCEIADKERIPLPVPEIHLFEELFLKSVRKNGRVQELRTVAEYNLRTLNPFKDLSQGLTLMRKGAISPFDMLKGHRKSPAVSNIFTKIHQARQGE